MRDYDDPNKQDDSKAYFRCQQCQSIREIETQPESKYYMLPWGSCSIRIASVILCDSCKSHLFAKIKKALDGDKI
jgi:hypothetical protein